MLKIVRLQVITRGKTKATARPVCRVAGLAAPVERLE
jgi:hypothetical protein